MFIYVFLQCCVIWRPRVSEVLFSKLFEGNIRKEMTAAVKNMLLVFLNYVNTNQLLTIVISLINILLDLLLTVT